MNRKWGFLCSSHHLCLLTEVCFDCSRPSWCEEKGTGVFAVPFKWNRPRFQCHWLPAVFFFPRVRQQVSKGGMSLWLHWTYCHNTCESRVFSERNQAGFYDFLKMFRLSWCSFMSLFTNLTFKKIFEGFFSDKTCSSAVLKPFVAALSKSLEFVLASCCLLLWVIGKCDVLGSVPGSAPRAWIFLYHLGVFKAITVKVRSLDCYVVNSLKN